MNRKIMMAIVIILALGCTAFAQAQQPAKVFRIGILSPRAGLDAAYDIFRQRLPELGYIEGQNAVIEWRFWDS